MRKANDTNTGSHSVEEDGGDLKDERKEAAAQRTRWRINLWRLDSVFVWDKRFYYCFQAES